MRTLGRLVLALSGVALLAGVGCSSEGFTPVCKPDLTDCLEPAKGGSFYVDGGIADTGPAPEAEASVGQDSGPDAEPDAVSEEQDDVQTADTQPSDSESDAVVAD